MAHPVPRSLRLRAAAEVRTITTTPLLKVTNSAVNRHHAPRVQDAEPLSSSLTALAPALEPSFELTVQDIKVSTCACSVCTVLSMRQICCAGTGMRTAMHVHACHGPGAVMAAANGAETARPSGLPRLAECHSDASHTDIPWHAVCIPKCSSPAR